MQDLLYTHAIPNHLASTVRTSTRKRQDHISSRDIDSNDVELLESGYLRCTIYSIPNQIHGLQDSIHLVDLIFKPTLKANGSVNPLLASVSFPQIRRSHA